MTDAQNKKQNPFQWIIIFVAIAAVVFGWLIFKNRQLSKNTPMEPAAGQEQIEAPERSSSETSEAGIAQSWYGKEAPNFTLSDLEGKKHSLTDYRGKDVIVVFWATWCGPCKMEAPHLIAAKNRRGDKLAILAVTNEGDTAAIKNFVSAMNINYTILTAPNLLPAPFNMVEYIPSSFFITPDGKLKVATQGVLEMGDIKAILDAKAE